jgi:hypothetical protein
MSSLTNVNNNAAVVVVGRTAPVPPGQQPASKSIPVVLATDQPPVPVVEQNKIASEVALSLLGIPRSEVALGIFADVNTYDVNPSEWSNTPAIREDYSSGDDIAYDGFDGVQGWGLKHIPEESGALVEAPADKTAVLTSKRFFRYQPGRVSSATFGIKTSIIPGDPDDQYRNPAIRKYGIFDNFDGYYWETRDTGKGDQFVVVRRTQSIITQNPILFGVNAGQQVDDFGQAGEPPSASNATGTPGDLVILRDGLVHIHAAVYDPSLLLEETNHSISAISSNKITLNISDGELENGQDVSYHTEETSSVTGLTKTSIYRVINKSAVDGSGNYTVELSELDDEGQGSTTITLGALSGTHVLRTPVPFIFPTFGVNGTGDIMFPYKRSFDIERNVLETSLGYIDTAKGSGESASQAFVRIAGEIGSAESGSSFEGGVNKLWENWVKHNVKPEFYKVYEYRIPRSRFSGEFLNGIQNTETTVAHDVLYSDVVRTGSGEDTIKFPGENVIDQNTSGNVSNESIWNLDFGKVVMQKIEFSWYGAVGALFLAYVPVSNGEARWVRVHHLRASNQLKVSSLGNATLPITYLVYGGGSENRFGYPNSSSSLKRLPNTVPGSGSYSQYITKYGASYYIDGGDRGTVRLYSHASPASSEIYGSKYRILVNASQSQESDPYLIVAETAPYDNNPNINDYYMGATLLTGDIVDQGIKVTWVDAANNRLYLNKALNSVTGTSVQMDILVDRPQIVYGLETKEEIISSQGRRVRNRVQVYPTRLTTGASGTTTVSLQLRKNPIFQTFDSYSGTLTVDQDIVVQAAGQPTPLTLSSTPTLQSGDSVYGWFRAYFTSDVNQFKFPVLGLLRRSGSNYSFTSKSAYSDEVKITGDFLVAGNYDEDGTPTVVAPPKSELERLSSVLINNELRTPIPGTGTQVTTFYIPPGGEIFDLSAYFDYNKDYLSYPLTDEIDSLFLTSVSVDRYYDIDGSGDPTGSPVLRSSVLASLTWEEQ